MPKNSLFRRLLKKVQMRGGALHCGMRIAECGMGGPAGRRAKAPPAAAGQREQTSGLFSSLPRQAVQAPVSRRLLKKVQMQGGARRAE
jgi:hypothetical protein